MEHYTGVAKVVRNATTKGNKNYEQVECIDGTKFNVFGQDVGLLFEGAKFEADFEKEGKYINVSNLVVDMSTPRPPGSYARDVSDRVTDRERQESIERQNGLTNLTNALNNPEFVWPEEFRQVQAKYAWGQAMNRLFSPPVAGEEQKPFE